MTRINGIPADLLRPNNDREENCTNRHSFSGEPGNVKEAIANMYRLFPQTGVAA